MPASSVIVVHRAPGFHFWKEAPEKAPEVIYLADRHRHVFTIRVEFPVDDDDRQVEFHCALAALKAALASAFHQGPHGYEFGRRSCEQIARDLREHVARHAGATPDAIEVWEDDENGARVDWSV